jgi:hypothetical protein
MQESLEDRVETNLELIESRIDEPDATLRARFAEDGYLRGHRPLCDPR